MIPAHYPISEPVPPMKFLSSLAILATAAALFASSTVAGDLVIYGTKVFTMAGEPIANGVVIVSDGKIKAVGKKGEITPPEDAEELSAAVVMPGIIDARTTVGLSGILNSSHDQEQLETSSPMQPELRAIDAYNGRDPLVKWLRDFGITTVNTGHSPGILISGQTMILKTNVDAIDADAVINPYAMLAGSLGPDAMADGGPGTRAKAVAMLRAEFLKAQDFIKKVAEGKEDAEKKPERDLRNESLAAVLEKKVPMAITVHRHQDIAAALRLAKEFDFNLILDGASEAHLMLDAIKEAGVSVLVHPTMQRPSGDAENMTMTLAHQLQEAGIPFAFQSGHESYVPKVHVVLFEAAMAATYGLSQESALAGITINAAKLLGISYRVGSLEPGKDADIALYDGDPLEFTSHCTGVVIDGEIVSRDRR
ncbi:MAG: imidazolonepropionase-like amidohydrolase [Verrucomicrobiales bacterium]|jgi:imidazolonepropionase-like amidohydrolase